jgi:hypothetical protein
LPENKQKNSPRIETALRIFRKIKIKAAPKRPRLDDDTRPGGLSSPATSSAWRRPPTMRVRRRRVCHFDAVVVAPRATRKFASAGGASPRCGSALTGVESPRVESPFRQI